MTASPRRRILRLLGLVLTVIAFVAFIQIFLQSVSLGEVEALLETGWQTLVFALAAYLLSYLPMSLGWIMLAKACGVGISRLCLARILLISQFAKYVPGNIGQFVGRVFLLERAGVSMRLTAAAMTLELACILTAGGVLIAAIMVFGLIGPVPDSARVAGQWPFIVCSGAVIALSSGIYWLRSVQRGNVANTIFKALFLFASTLVMLSLITVIILRQVAGVTDVTLYPPIAAAFLVSWLAGFATPGAPAGLGVREVVFLALLQDEFSVSALSLTIMTVRATTIIGDFLALVIGLGIKEAGDRKYTSSADKISG